MTDVDLSVVVPAHEPSDVLRRCLEALSSSRPCPAEVLVVVDGADPATVRLAADHPVVTRVLSSPERRGPGHARNLGARAASSDVVLFIDSDVLVHPETVGRAWEVVDDDDTIAAAIGSYDDAPPAPGALSTYKNLLNHRVHQQAVGDGSTFWGACGVVRREVFLAVGGFDDEHYDTPSIEDIELGYRLTDAGHRLVVVGDLLVTHAKQWRAVDLLRTDVLGRALPWAQLQLARGGLDDSLNTRRGERAKVALAGATALAASLAAAPGLRARTRRRLVGTAAAGLTAGLAANAPLTRFLLHRGGVRVAAAGSLWHWASHVYGGFAFAVAVVRHLTGTSDVPTRHRNRGSGTAGRGDT